MAHEHLETVMIKKLVLKQEFRMFSARHTCTHSDIKKNVLWARSSTTLVAFPFSSKR